MADVIFYEKPGCAGNARQKELLRRAGHRLEVRDLLAEPWSSETLLPFLAGVPVEAWFNRTAPRVKSGEVVPKALDPDAALALLLEDHLLIRRPLLQSGARREVGFLAAVVQDWIGLDPPEPVSCGGLEGCGRGGSASGPSHQGDLVALGGLGRPGARAGGASQLASGTLGAAPAFPVARWDVNLLSASPVAALPRSQDVPFQPAETGSTPRAALR